MGIKYLQSNKKFQKTRFNFKITCMLFELLGYTFSTPKPKELYMHKRIFSSTLIFSGIIGAFLLVGCLSPDVTSNENSDASTLRTNGSNSDTVTSDKVVVCHIPPGNPANAHTITVGASAVRAHLAHGDALGACKETHPPVCDTCNGLGVDTTRNTVDTTHNPSDTTKPWIPT